MKSILPYAAYGCMLALSMTSALAGTKPFTIQWTDVAGETGYDIERQTGNSGTWAVIATLPANTTAYTDTSSLKAGTVYSYRVNSYNGLGQSSYSTPVWNVRGNGTGTVAVGQWTNIGGTAVSAIPVNTAPNAGSVITSLDINNTGATNYGRYIRGYIVPSKSASYTFFIAGDDNAEFWLSTDNTPANKTKLASVSGWTNYQQWNKYTTQKSVKVTLSAGKSYYFEVLQKQGTGGDNVSVGWSTASAPTAPTSVVPGANLAPY